MMLHNVFIAFARTLINISKPGKLVTDVKTVTLNSSF